MQIDEERKLLKKNFIGPDELTSVAAELGIAQVARTPKIQFDEKLLKRVAKTHLLILGVEEMSDGRPLTLNNMRAHFGLDPTVSEPCFYNQDWYLKEKFASATTLRPRWYLLRKDVAKETRAVRPDILEKKQKRGERFPSAILTAFAFFSYLLLTKKTLWKHDFIWCSDKDKNGDRIYTGRYEDPKRINKNGFNIHRHLSIRRVYGAVTQID